MLAGPGKSGEEALCLAPEVRHEFYASTLCGGEVEEHGVNRNGYGCGVAVAGVSLSVRVHHRLLVACLV